ncbi:MAG: gliding motility-associated C-terminal domain-containing protein, partial [Bacteroidota bacterium]
FTNNPDLTGDIPVSIKDLANLEELTISSTGINKFDVTSILPLSNLKRLSLKNNKLEDLPDLSSMANLEAFEVENNQLTFEDIIPNKERLTSYAPQADIGNPDNPVLNVGADYEYNLPNFDARLDNHYQWFKDGVPFIEGRNLKLDNIGELDAGEYYCEITNDEIPELTLYSRKITLRVAEDCRLSDYNALKRIYEETDGFNWTWDVPANQWDFISDPATVDMTNWEGLQFNDEGCITGLFLINKGLNGALPIEVGDLINLDSLVIRGNTNLTGAIPLEIGLIEPLTYIDLSSNSLEQEIPSSIIDLKSLTYLNLSKNKLRGEIPQNIGALNKLHQLVLSDNLGDGNGLSGEIPVSIQNLTVLDTLILNQNKFSGQIPPETGALQNLKYLELSENQFSGDLPAQLFNATSLESLSIFGNNLTGNIPAEITQLNSLKELNIRDNDFTGDLPNGFATAQITRLLINGNNFENIGDLSALSLVAITNVADNMLTFEDLIDYVDQIDFYNPQDSVGEQQIEELIVGQDYIFDLNIDVAVTSNTYTWKKDGVTVDVNNVNRFSIIDATLEDAGEYTCEVTNPNLEDLTLYSRKFILTTNNTGGDELSILGDSIVCLRSSKEYIVVNSSGDVTWSVTPADTGVLTSPNTTATDVFWIGAGVVELSLTDNISGNSITKIVTVVDKFDPPEILFKPVLLVNDPFEDIFALGIQNAEYNWYFQDELIFTGTVFNPANVTENGFSNTNPGSYDFEVIQSADNCQSDPAKFRVRIVEIDLPNPENLVAERQGESTVKLEWEFVQGTLADSIVIERSINNINNFEIIDIVPYEGINEYIDNLILEEGNQYFYRIRLADFENNRVSPYSNIANVSIGVGINNPPIVSDISKLGDLEDNITFAFTDFENAFSDPDGDILVSVIIETPSENGTLFLGNIAISAGDIINATELGSLLFVPNNGWSGETSFSYNASDGELTSLTPADVNIIISEIDISMPADLIISASADALAVFPEGSINFEIVGENIGERVANDFNIQVYISNDSLISVDDILISEERIDSLAETPIILSQTITIPTEFPTGEYVIIFYIDSNNGVEEVDETNNLAYLAIIVREILQDPVIPNIITPNGDLINDLLIIENVEQYPQNKFQVLDKWGNEVFSSEGYQNNWPGTDSEGALLPAGNYIGIFTVSGDQSSSFSEVITIIRE